MSEKNILGYKNIVGLISVFIVFLPPTFISGPLLPDLLISISALGCLYLFSLGLFSNFWNNLYFKSLIIFWIYIVLVSIFSQYGTLTLKPSLTFIRFVLFSFFIIYLFKNDKKILFKFNIILIIALIILNIDGFYQFFFKENLIGYKLIRPDRLSSFFGDELILGSYLSKIMPILFFFLYEHLEFNKIKYLNILLIISSLLLIFLTGERAAFIMTVLFLIITLPFIFNFKYIFLIFLISISLITFFLKSNDIIYDRYYEQMKIHLIKKIDNHTIYLPEHVGLFDSAFYIFKNNVYFGTGVKTFREECKKNQSKFKNLILSKNSQGARLPIKFCETHPHNYYLQFLAELGIFGFSFLFIFFMYCIFIYIYYFYKVIVKQNKIINFNQYIISLNGIIVALWPLTTNGNFFNNWLSGLFFLQVSLLIYNHEKLLKQN